MIGDSETDAEAAKAAKIKFILVKGGYTEKKLRIKFINDYLIESIQ